MGWLPSSALLGKLEIEEVFVEYDGPRVFSCRSTTDQLYLAGWAEERPASDVWLYLPVSAARLQMVRSGRWPLGEAFLRPEGAVYQAVLHHDNSLPDEVEPVAPSDIPEEWLPEGDYSLDLQTPTLPPAIRPSELARRAEQEGRTRLRIEIDSPGRKRSEGTTRRVAALLKATQNVLDNFGLVELDADPAQDGRFAREVIEKMDTDVLELAAASFVIELGSEDGEDLFGDSPIARVTDRLVRLLSSQLRPEDLWDALSDLKPRAAKSFRGFVGELAALSADVTIATASTSRRLRQETLRADQLTDLFSLLRQLVPDEIRLVRGRMKLYAGNTENRRFGLRDLWSGQAYEGRVGERAVPQVLHATLGDTYEVVLSEYAATDRAVGFVSQRFVLEQLVRADDDTPVEATIEVVTNVPSGPIF